MPNKREFYRIEYAPGDQPIFLHFMQKFKVLELSEGGFSFSFEGVVSIREGEELAGDIQFGSRGKLWMKGVVVRIAYRRVSVRFHADGQIPLAKIMEEQRFLIQKNR